MKIRPARAEISMQMARQSEVDSAFRNFANVPKNENILNPLNAKLNPICHLLALLGAHPLLHVSRIRVKQNCPCHGRYFKHGIPTGQHRS
jgi:hypothetical protein